MNFSPKIPKNKHVYSCDKCDIITRNKKDYNKHVLTSKHKKICEGYLSNPENPIVICECGNEYKHYSGLWRHKKNCNLSKEQNIIIDDTDNNENVIIQDSSSNEIKVLTSLVLELVKSNQDLQKQMIDVCQKIQPITSSVINNNNNTTTNTTNSHNKTFNLQFFLNEQCKDAMNIKDFVKSIKIEMSDLERIGKEGYVEGISRIILEKLKNTDIYKRPLHCSDAKRETMYIKENDVWNKDESLNNEKMIQFIKDVDNKNYDFLLKYAKEYPEVYQHDSKRNTPYLHMVLQSTRDVERVNKVIKRIIKEVVINKDI